MNCWYMQQLGWILYIILLKWQNYRMRNRLGVDGLGKVEQELV